MNKASMIMEICSDLKIPYLKSMYNMNYDDVRQLYLKICYKEEIV